MSNNSHRVLVTGGAGFIGAHVVDRALSEGSRVVCVDNLYSGRYELVSRHMNNPNFTFVRHDVQHPLPDDIVQGREGKFNLIFHLACPASPVFYQNDPINTTLTCVNGTYHILQLATQHDCPVLISSTSEVYGDPEVHPQTEDYAGSVRCTGIRSCYDEGKRCAESLCFDFHRRYNTRIRVARIFNTYGPHMRLDDGRVVTNFLAQALENRDITIYGDGTITRSFQYIDDLVEGFWRLIHHPSEIGPVNLGNDEEFTLNELSERVIKLVPDSHSKVVYCAPAEDDPRQRKPDITKARQVLDWKPRVNLEDGLTKFIHHIRQNCSLSIKK